MSGGPTTGAGAGAGDRPGGTGVYEVTQGSAYDTNLGNDGHSNIAGQSDIVDSSPIFVSDLAMVALAATAATAVWIGEPVVAVAMGLAFAAGFRSGAFVVVALLIAGVGAVRSDQAWSALAPDELGQYDGWVRLVDDPQPFASSTRIILEVDGERYEMWSRGRAQQLRIREWRGGQWVSVSGNRIRLDDQRARRVAWQHVVGEFDLEWASDVFEGDGIARASNRVRRAIERAGEALPADDGALFRGLVVGDDRDQPRAMIQRFRASGLSHLTAVSGQNVSFLLAACGPLLRRLRPWPRLALTVGLILWFVTLTRFEPSIVRAGAMASLSAVAYATGRQRAPLRILAIAVIALVLIDPLLVWSIGFWLSVGATAGVTTVGPWLARRLSGLGLFAMPLGITIGAQIGVLVPSVLVFGRLPLVSVPANVLAVPVAGAVMLYGLPAGLLAGWVPPLAPVVMFPARFGTRWVDTVAMLGERLEPPQPWPWIGWILIAVISVAFVVIGTKRDKNQALHGDTSTDR